MNKTNKIIFYLNIIVLISYLFLFGFYLAILAFSIIYSQVIMAYGMIYSAYSLEKNKSKHNNSIKNKTINLEKERLRRNIEEKESTDSRIYTNWRGYGFFNKNKHWYFKRSDR